MYPAREDSVTLRTRFIKVSDVSPWPQADRALTPRKANSRKYVCTLKTNKKQLVGSRKLNAVNDLHSMKCGSVER